MFGRLKKRGPESCSVKDIWVAADLIRLVDKDGRVVSKIPAKEVRMFDLAGDMRITGSIKEGFHIVFPEPVTCNLKPGTKELYCEKRYDMPEAEQ